MSNWQKIKDKVLKRVPDYDVSELGAVMWPVLYPTTTAPEHKPHEPHVTVVVFKGIAGLDFTANDIIETVREVSDTVMLWLTTGEVEWFGPDSDVPVLRVDHDYLYTFRDSLLTLLYAKGFEPDMTYPEYKPHITITEAAAKDGVHPLYLLAGPVEVWWGNERHKVHVR